MSEPQRAPGRPARLSRNRIAEAAVALADARGLESVTMRSVAEALASTPGALYRHVAGRDVLVAAMADTALSELAWPAPSGGPTTTPPATTSAQPAPAHSAAAHSTGTVRDDLTAAASALIAVHLGHPWLADVPPTPRPVGRSAQLVGSLLAILERTAATEPAMWAALAVFLNLVSGSARWGGAAAGALTAEQAADIIVDAVMGVLHPQR